MRSPTEGRAPTARPFNHPGCSTVGSAPRSGRGGRKFESSHPDPLRAKACKPSVCRLFCPPTGTNTGQDVFPIGVGIDAPERRASNSLAQWGAACFVVWRLYRIFVSENIQTLITYTPMNFEWNRISSWIDVIAMLCLACGIIFFFAALLSSYSSFLLSLVPLLYGGLAFLFWRGFGIIVKAAEYYIADKEYNSYESEDED